MANLFQYLLIISIATISMASGRFHRPTQQKFYDLFDLDNLNNNDATRNDYLFVPSSNPEPKSDPGFVESDHSNDRMTRYLADNEVMCEILVTKGVFAEKGYEFFPREYINKTCIPTSADPFVIESNGIRKPEMCLHNDNDFGCQTLYEELNILKRSVGGTHRCWEHMTQLVAVGCKCNIHFKY